MNKEDYVSLEVAKLLKEKGFNEICKSSILNNGELRGSDNYLSIDDMMRTDTTYYEFLAPTLYEANKWIRKKHKLIVSPYYLSDGKYTFFISIIDKELTYNIYGKYNTYEEAFNSGILAALKMIDHETKIP